jgi:hypothetical protein
VLSNLQSAIERAEDAPSRATTDEKIIELFRGFLDLRQFLGGTNISGIHHIIFWTAIKPDKMRIVQKLLFTEPSNFREFSLSSLRTQLNSDEESIIRNGGHYAPSY